MSCDITTCAARDLNPGPQFRELGILDSITPTGIHRGRSALPLNVSRHPEASMDCNQSCKRPDENLVSTASIEFADAPSGRMSPCL